MTRDSACRTSIVDVLWCQELAGAIFAGLRWRDSRKTANASWTWRRAFAEESEKLQNRKYLVAYDVSSESHQPSMLQCFDPGEFKWRAFAPTAEHRGDTVALTVHDGYLYACGGAMGSSLDGDFRALDSVERFDPVVGVWQVLPKLVQPRSAPTVVACKGCLFACGGRSHSVWPTFAPDDAQVSCIGTSVLNSVERLVVEEDAPNQWEQISPMALPRYLSEGAVLQGCIYIVGGVDATDSTTNSVERLLPEAGWEGLPSMTMCRCRPNLSSDNFFRDRLVAAAVASALFVWGGSHVLFLERFSPASGEWDVFCMPHAIPWPILPSPSAAVLNGSVYIVFGGWEWEHANASPPIRFDPSDESWEALPCMGLKHGRAGCCSIGSFLYVCGETDTAVERFHPITRLWEALPPMPQQRHSLAFAVTL